jgi:serine/threonine protein kinase
VDIKPDNFMIAFDPPHVKKPSPVHTRIRVIDVGLFESFKDAVSQKHRQDIFPTGKVVGTPIYASIHVLQGHGVSRRDDMEALGYVLLEMILLILHTARDTSGGKKNHGGLPAHGLLPWSDGKSDAEILERKKAMMDKFLQSNPKNVVSKSRTQVTPTSTDSSLWNDLTSLHYDSVGFAMKEFMTRVRNMDYDEKPNYVELRSIVSKIHVRLSANKVPLKQPRTSLSSQQSTSNENSASHIVNRNIRRKSESTDMDVSEKKATRVLRKRVVTQSIVEEYYEDAAADDENEEEEDDCKKPWKKSVKKSTPIVEITDSLEDETTYDTAPVGDDMDWECMDSVKPSDDNPVLPSLQLMVVEGPHKGESMSVSTSCVLGRASKKCANPDFMDLRKDAQIGSCHAKVSFCRSSKGILSLRVTDQKQSNGTLVNNRKIPSGGYRQVFVGDKIQIGSSVLEVKR